MSALEIRIEEHLTNIARIGADSPGKGWTRLAFSEEESDAHRYAASVLSKLGCEIHTDSFQNLIAVLPGENSSSKSIMLGTHLDTVKNGGNYDGVVGFIVAVEAVEELLANNRSRPNLTICVFRAEESTRFKKACLGSRAAFIGLDDDTISLEYTNREGIAVSLGQTLKQCGGNASLVRRPTLDSSIYSAYFETHIEQARVLEQKCGLDSAADISQPQPLLGIVTSIRAPHRCEWEVFGQGSLQLFCRSVLAVENAALFANQLGLDAVATVGRVDDFIAGADKINAIPGSVDFPLPSVSQSLKAEMDFVAANRKCRVEIFAADHNQRVRVSGTTDHSGGTPMGLNNRQDALAAACDILLRLPVTINPACPRISFATDVRSRSIAERDFVSDLIRKEFDALDRLSRDQSRDLRAAKIEKIRRTERSEPITSLSVELQDALADCARQLGIDTQRLPSGAGHDAMMAATAGIPTAMLFVPSIKGLSHNPEESSRTKDIAAAVAVQAQILENLGSA